MKRWRGPVWLDDSLEFPAPERAADGGLLAIGGDLSPERLLAAYRRGIFPWPWFEDEPMLWWCPDPRFVLYPAELHVPKSLRRYEVRLDTAFEEVVRGCAEAPRPEGAGTWITPSMREAYVRLHRLGFAHSAESWAGTELAGGLYGVSLGGVFFGESMFYRRPDASKAAFVGLVRQVRAWGFRLIDCQLETAHLARFGARHVPRPRFLAELAEALEMPNRVGPWRSEE